MWRGGARRLTVPGSARADAPHATATGKGDKCPLWLTRRVIHDGTMGSHEFRGMMVDFVTIYRPVMLIGRRDHTTRAR
jgi:hypothetical protein